MYKIKQVPEDFIVKEKNNLKISEQGAYTYFVLRKINQNTEEAVYSVARTVKKRRKDFGYAGNKDRNAITEQLVSVRGSIQDFENEKISIKIVGKGNSPISLGELEGNYFEITVRNLTEEDIALLDYNIGQLENKKMMFVNYYDRQRFSRNNAQVGELIVKAKYQEAVELLTAGDGRIEETMKQHLKYHPNDYVGAIKTLPKNIIRLYVHAFQSKLWNEVAGNFEKRKEQLLIPLLGFGTEFQNGEVKQLYEEVMEKFQVTQRDFILKGIKEHSQEGDLRNLFAQVEKFDISKRVEDELNKGMEKIMVKFFLQKGSYATLVIKNLFQPK